MKTVGTLKELNVKPGDVVEWCGSKYIALEEPKPKYADEVWAGTEGKGWIADDAEECTVISRAADTPTLWRDMTPEEKGALLLAHHEGKEIEWNATSIKTGEWTGWDTCDDDCLWDNTMCGDGFAYRIKPQPKVEVVTSMWAYEKGGKDGFYHPSNRNATHRITFNTIDGKPDPASIKMEEL